jgi:hypothetical protein
MLASWIKRSVVAYLQCTGIAVVGLVGVAHPAAAEVQRRCRCFTVTALCRHCGVWRCTIIVIHAVQGQAQGHDGDAGLGGEAKLVDVRRYGSGLRRCDRKGAGVSGAKFKQYNTRQFSLPNWKYCSCVQKTYGATYLVQHVRHDLRQLNAAPLRPQVEAGHQPLPHPRTAHAAGVLCVEPTPYDRLSSCTCGVAACRARSPFCGEYRCIRYTTLFQPQAPQRFVWKIIDDYEKNAKVTNSTMFLFLSLWRIVSKSNFRSSRVNR